MQQITYHGIASYKFEYQLSTGGDWTTAATTPSTATSYNYTYQGLTAETRYNLKVTVIDHAGNIGAIDGNSTTISAGYEPIEADIGKPVYYVPKTNTFSKEILKQYSGSTNNSYDFSTDSTLRFIWNLDDRYMYLVPGRVGKGTDVANGKIWLGEYLGYNNGLTLLNQICSTCFSNSAYSDLSVKHMALSDLELYFFNLYRNPPLITDILHLLKNTISLIFGDYMNNGQSASIANSERAFGLTEEEYSLDTSGSDKFWQNGYVAQRPRI